MTEEVESDLILLSPVAVHLDRPAPNSATVRLTIEGDPSVSGDRCYSSVRVARAFPLSDPDRYIGLRDSNDKDIGILVTLDGVSVETRSIITEELERRYFLPVWKRTIRLKDEFNVVEWEMETTRGTRTFRLRNIKDSVQHLGAGRVLVTDTEGNRFEVANTDALDNRAYESLSRAL